MFVWYAVFGFGIGLGDIEQTQSDRNLDVLALRLREAVSPLDDLHMRRQLFDSGHGNPTSGRIGFT